MYPNRLAYSMTCVVLAALCAVCAAQDLVSNGGFEGGGETPAGWRVQTCTAARVSLDRDAPCPEGSQSLKIDLERGGTVSLRTRPEVPITPGGAYLVSYWARASRCNMLFSIKVDGNCLTVVRAVRITHDQTLDLLWILRVLGIGFVKQVQGDVRTTALVVTTVGYQ